MKLPSAKVIESLKATEINPLKFFEQPNQFVIPMGEATLIFAACATHDFVRWSGDQKCFTALS